MRYKLSQLFDIIGGGTPKTERKEYWGGTIPWLSVKDFNNDRRYVYKSEKCITEQGLANSSTTLLQKGDIIISARGTVGEMASIPFPMAFNQSCYGLRAKKDLVDSDFLYYLVKLKVVELKHNSHGSVFDTITRDTFDGIEVNIPPRVNQEKIGKLLTQIDEKIELNNAINYNLQQQAEALFKAWFVEYLPFGGVQPSDMQYVPLEKLCAIVTKGTTPTTLGKPFTDCGVHFVKAESILDTHAFDPSKFCFIDDETHRFLKRSVIANNDILFTIAGTLGRFAMVDDEILPANTNQAVAIIRADASISPYYLYSFFLGNWHIDYYSKRIQQAVQANLSLATIKSLPIPILGNTEMQEFLSIFEPIIKRVKCNEIENRRLVILRDTLLPKLMRGEIDVSDVEI